MPPGEAQQRNKRIYLLKRFAIELHCLMRPLCQCDNYCDQYRRLSVNTNGKWTTCKTFIDRENQSHWIWMKVEVKITSVVADANYSKRSKSRRRSCLCFSHPDSDQVFWRSSSPFLSDSMAYSVFHFFPFKAIKSISALNKIYCNRRRNLWTQENMGNLLIDYCLRHTFVDINGNLKAYKKA